ncbi:hypothetical protein AVEN_3233-1 [Araneus ventricosus]|uniref:Uncharacterized protein n=1 Tax=Araneus ventricosus TaxID=182803 RepID=A0A4Y2G7F2_ARAVE|nr:hypothetical protein AVEN_3233-1 [Araneus ventricosus]
MNLSGHTPLRREYGYLVHHSHRGQFTTDTDVSSPQTQRREQCTKESQDERFQRRSARNAADRLRRARARNEQQMANRVNSQVETNVSEHDCSLMMEICNFCQALHWRNELNSSNNYTKCCHDDNLRLPNLAETPDLLKELLTNNSPEARDYQQHIRE